MDIFQPPLDREAIERILPHRPPFLLVDRITELEPGRRIVGVKNVAHGEPFLVHRSRQAPALPPTILLEAVAQVGAILVLAVPENRDKLAFFMEIRRARFRSPVVAGDLLVIEARVRRLGPRMGSLDGHATVDGRAVAEGTVSFALGSAPPA